LLHREQLTDFPAALAREAAVHSRLSGLGRLNLEQADGAR